MRKFLIYILLCSCFSGFAQDDLLSEIDTETVENDFAFAAFKGLKIVNFENNEGETQFNPLQEKTYRGKEITIKASRINPGATTTITVRGEKSNLKKVAQNWCEVNRGEDFNKECLKISKSFFFKKNICFQNVFVVFL